jgi:dephospho-CoA kinase
MLKVGLTGGLATGKSFVAQALQDLGCHIIRADQLGHQVLASTGSAYVDVVREFGPEILLPNGEIDRRRLGAEVFGKPDRLALLNSLVHPRVFELEEQQMAEAAKLDPTGISVVEAAILIETGRYKIFDRLILTVCSEAEQIQRAMERDRLTESEVRARLASQMPLAGKRKFADYVIDTSGNKEHALEQTVKVYQLLRSTNV